MNSTRLNFRKKAVELDHQLEEIEKKRQKLIKKLLAYNVFKVDDKQLFELSLPELKTELVNIEKTTHPHCGANSIQWN